MPDVTLYVKGGTFFCFSRVYPLNIVKVGYEKFGLRLL